MKTGIVFDKRFALHQMGEEHIESPLRIIALYELVQTRLKSGFTLVEPRPATTEEIQMVHLPEYVSFLKETAGREDYYQFDPDTIAGPYTYEAACLAAGAGLTAADLILEGKLDNALALVRPPGHHAESHRPMGFCFFNNIAITAEYLRRKKSIRRILIVDWDLHHGNGTQNCFADDPSVLFFSTHKAFAWVTFRDFKLALWYTLTLAPGECYLVYIFVHPYFAGRGVGTYLLGKLMREMRDLGAVRMISGMYRNWEVSFGLHT
ncbi:MAG TPA: hypothetical protein DCR87_07760, partial [Acidobacteria bacterium]|nr:hypothetical protein [Acidobacteriota bacterium]